jgi:hypothetical protein
VVVHVGADGTGHPETKRLLVARTMGSKPEAGWPVTAPGVDPAAASAGQPHPLLGPAGRDTATPGVSWKVQADQPHELAERRVK